jgi:lipopolysaccharide heptosyltransferase II
MTPLPESATSSPAPRILVRATNWLGDSVMMMPAVQRLRELNPSPSHVALLCPAKLHDLWRHNAFVDEVLAFDGTVDIRVLREHRFDLAVLFPNSLRSAWEAWQAGIPRRVGFVGHARRFLLTDIVREPRGDRPVHKTVVFDGKRFRVKHFEPIRHQVYRHLDLVGHLGGNIQPVPPKIWVDMAIQRMMSQILGGDHRPLIGVSAGAEYGPAKRWPLDCFANVAARILEKKECRFALLGVSGDSEITAAIEARLRPLRDDPKLVVNLAGKTTLMELCAVLRCCRVVMTNDTGTMHLAGALDVPQVAIFGSTSPELTGPLSDRAIVIRHPVECSPCFRRECPIDFRCMTRVTVDEVTEAALKLL